MNVPLGKTTGGTLDEPMLLDSGIPVELMRWVEAGSLFGWDVEYILMVEEGFTGELWDEGKVVVEEETEVVEQNDEAPEDTVLALELNEVVDDGVSANCV